jgi:maltose alpha-D-glucosyltransferase/alpha-amylase
LRQIALRTAEFHHTLASRSDIPAFAPEPIDQDDIARWADDMAARVEDVSALLEQNRHALTGEAADLAATLLRHRREIKEHIEATKSRTVSAFKIRHHGDFHLGQILIVKDDAYLLDFEGEPRRSLADRRRKAPAARDVAGVCRSIDYATSAALNRVDDIKPEELQQLSNRVRRWSGELIDAYWAAYRDALTDERLWPSDPKESRELLDFFILEKALYEIEYELTNRPTWVNIPLEATMRILRQQGVITS